MSGEKNPEPYAVQGSSLHSSSTNKSYDKEVMLMFKELERVGLNRRTLLVGFLLATGVCWQSFNHGGVLGLAIGLMDSVLIFVTLWLLTREVLQHIWSIWSMVPKIANAIVKGKGLPRVERQQWFSKAVNERAWLFQIAVLFTLPASLITLEQATGWRLTRLAGILAALQLFAWIGGCLITILSMLALRLWQQERGGAE